jgi:prophage regulatory protein
MVRRILRRREVESVTGKPRSSIYAGIADGTFPKPIPLGEKAVGWLEDEIIQWQKDRIAERGRPRGASTRRRKGGPNNEVQQHFDVGASSRPAVGGRKRCARPKV